MYLIGLRQFKGVYEGTTKSKWVQEQAFLPVGHLGSGLHHVSGPKGSGPGERGRTAQVRPGVGRWGMAECRRGTGGHRCAKVSRESLWVGRWALEH